MTRENSTAPVTLDVTTASQILGVSEYLVRKLVRERKLPHIRLGGAILFRQTAIDQFLQDQELASIRSGGTVTSGIRKVSE